MAKVSIYSFSFIVSETVRTFLHVSCQIIPFRSLSKIYATFHRWIIQRDPNIHVFCLQLFRLFGSITLLNELVFDKFMYSSWIYKYPDYLLIQMMYLGEHFYSSLNNMLLGLAVWLLLLLFLVHRWTVTWCDLTDITRTFVRDMGDIFSCVVSVITYTDQHI